MSHRIFSKPRPQELLTRPQSSGGFYHLKTSEDLIRYHRKLKNRTLTDWTGRVHGLLTVGLVLSFLAVLLCVWMSVLDVGVMGDEKAAQKWFLGAVGASCLAGVLTLGKVVMNSTYPPK